MLKVLQHIVYVILTSTNSFKIFYISRQLCAHTLGNLRDNLNAAQINRNSRSKNHSKVFDQSNKYNYALLKLLLKFVATHKKTKLKPKICNPMLVSSHCPSVL